MATTTTVEIAFNVRRYTTFEIPNATAEEIAALAGPDTAAALKALAESGRATSDTWLDEDGVDPFDSHRALDVLDITVQH